MDFVIEYGFLLIAAFCAAAFVLIYVGQWLKMPRAQQMHALKQWLLLAVLQAEKEFGKQTGQLKLRYVYDLALTKFPFIPILSFSVFANLVDEALEQMKLLLRENESIQQYIKKE